MAYNVKGDGGVIKSSLAHDVRMTINYTKEVNYGNAVYRVIYEELGLHEYMKKLGEKAKLDFDLDAVIFAICFFNVEYKLSDPLDIKDLHKRRCLFDFSQATEDNIIAAMSLLQVHEPDFYKFITEKSAKLVKKPSQRVKHSPNAKVVLKSVAYLIRCLFIARVLDAGYKITKEPLFILLNDGTILRPTDESVSEGFLKVNKAFGRYGSGTDDQLLTVRKLMKVFNIDASLPMRNATEILKAIPLHLALNPVFYSCPQDLKPCEDPCDIDLKIVQVKSVVKGVDFLFAEHREAQLRAKIDEQLAVMKRDRAQAKRQAHERRSKTAPQRDLASGVSAGALS